MSKEMIGTLIIIICVIILLGIRSFHCQNRFASSEEPGKISAGPGRDEK